MFFINVCDLLEIPINKESATKVRQKFIIRGVLREVSARNPLIRNEKTKGLKNMKGEIKNSPFQYLNYYYL